MEVTPTTHGTSPSPPSTTPAVRRPYRVVSFPGAGFDTVMQMGVIHALLVTRRKPPEMVGGISVGAITAAALGEVLQSDAGSEASANDDEEVRVARFSELLEAFRNAPSTVLKGIFPDPLETNAAHALKPVELPRHFKEERDSREDAATSRTGVIRLFNHLIRMRVTVKVFAQLSRVLMGWRAVAESNWKEKWVKRFRLIARLWFLVTVNIFSLAMPVSLIARIELCALLGINGKANSRGVEAGHIIFNRWAWFRLAREHFLWLFLGFFPLFFSIAVIPAILIWGLAGCLDIQLPIGPSVTGWTSLIAATTFLASLVAWGTLFFKKTLFPDILKHYHIYNDLGDSYSLKEVLVQSFDPTYFGEFNFDDGVRRALKQEKPSSGGCKSRKTLKSYAETKRSGQGVRVVPLAANLGSGKLEAIPSETAVVDALMCACAMVPFFRGQSIQRNGVSATFIDGISVSNDPIMPVLEEACKCITKSTDPHWDYVRIISVPLLPLKQEKPHAQSEPYTGLIDVTLRARELRRFQDMFLDKSLIDRVSRALGGKVVTFTNESGGHETFFPAKVRLVAPERTHQLSLRMMQAGSAAERRELIDSAVADGCRALIERLVTDAMPDTRTLEERRLLLEPDEEPTDEWPHRDETNQVSLRAAVESLRSSKQTITQPDGTEYVSCRKLMAAWGGMKALPGGDAADTENPFPGPGVSGICRCCISCNSKTGEDGIRTQELRQHIRLPRATAVSIPPPTEPVAEIKGPAVVFLYSGGVFRGVFQVGFSNAVSELGIQPDVVAGASVGTIVGALTGRAFQKPAGTDLLQRQRHIRRLAATFLTIDRFVLTDRFADFIRHFSIHASSADFSLHDLDLVFRRYEKDSGFKFGRRARRVFSGIERLLYTSPFELLELAQALRGGHLQKAAKQSKKLAQDMVDRYGVGLELLGPEPLQQLIDGFVFDGKSEPSTRLDYFGFPIIGTTTNLTLGKLDILRSTNPWDPRFTQSLLAGSAFPAIFRPRWSWEIYREPGQVAQYADGGIMDNLPLGAVVEYLWGKDSSARYERRPAVPHLILTATLEPEKADWSEREDLSKLSWTEIRARANQLRYNAKIDKFQLGQRDIRRILNQRISDGDPDANASDIPLNLDVLAVKPQWLCGSFAFHPMLGFSRTKQTESIAHGCASTLCAVADHFDVNNRAHGVDPLQLRDWARERGIALDQLPQRLNAENGGALGYGPANLSAQDQEEGYCWFRSADPKTGKRPVCPFHSKSAACCEGDEVAPELQKIYLACGRRSTHSPRSS